MGQPGWLRWCSDDMGFESLPITVTERSKARVCGRSLPVFAGLNPFEGMDVCVVCCK